MPSGFLATLPADVLLDAGVLQVGSTPIGVSRGGLTSSLEEEWRNTDFDGKRADVEGLDRKIGITARFSGTFLPFGTADVARLENAESVGVRTQTTASVTPGISAAFSYTPGDSLQSATVTRASTATYMLASQLFGPGRYLTDLRLVFRRGSSATGLCTIVFPVALCNTWSAKGNEKAEGEISAEFSARLDLTNSTNTDLVPYTVEITT